MLNWAVLEIGQFFITGEPWVRASGADRGQAKGEKENGHGKE
jgi:hypothetical protein